MSTEGYDSADASQQQPAELVMDQIYVLPEGARDSDSLQIGAQVRNDGPIESGPFSVRFYLDGAVISELPFESINPGQKEWKELEHAALTPGAHHLAAMADYENAVRESNKNDNLGTFDFQIVETPGVINEEPDVIEVPVVQMGARSTAVDEINRIVEGYAAASTELWTRYAQGLSRFGQRMEFASGAEAEFNMDAVAKGAALGLFKSALSFGIGKIPVPGLSVVVGEIQGGVEAYFAESDRSNKAWNEHEIVDYLEKVDKEIESGRTKMGSAIRTGMVKPLLDEFDRVSADDPQQGNATKDGRLVGGKGAEFVLDLRQKLADFNAHMPEAADFQRDIGVAFAQRASRSGEVQGQLIFHIDLFRLPGGWAPSKAIGWDLETSAPGDHTRLAESLAKSLNGKHAWQLDLPKIVYLSLSSDRGDDPWVKGKITFTTDPLHPKMIEAIETSAEINRAENTLTEVWELNSTRDLALESDEIVAA